MNNRSIFIIAAIVALTGNAQTPADKVLFKTDFESANADSVPEELMVLAGQFSVKEIGGNKALELPGTPLEDFGALFGPAESDGVAVRARVRSESTKRLAPRFGVGLSGVSGYRLLVSPGPKRAATTEGPAGPGVGTFRVEAGHMDIAAPAGPQDFRGQMDHRRTSVGRTELPSQKIGRYPLKSRKPRLRAKPRSGEPPIRASQFCSTI